ncbi:pyrimidine reductase [Dictyobacter sp. S3.2.2.5]|uniref:Pyrimidine reductase n=1 Tax=Dictyobacter halimunensis TaxID=3026934 RepID=A0ABQ6FY29_9CHLR|nr:pyrimidine reductase [Dictyobacter sp. S3.2.2.5]
MRKVVMSQFVSLDGVVEDPGGVEGYQYGGWAFRFGSTEQQQVKIDELFQANTLLLGRRTYEGFAAVWPTMQGTGAYGERMNSLPKYIASTTLTEMTWNATPLTGDLAEAISKLKQEEGQDILIFGSIQLVQTLHNLRLIDEYRLMVFPLILGRSRRLFSDTSEMQALQLVENKLLPSGVLTLTYHPTK